MISVATIFLIFSFTFNPTSTKAQGPTIEQIGQEMGRRLRSRDEEFTVNMKIIEADGSSKERQMQIWRLSPQKKEHSLLVRMQKPQDLKGTALLAIMKGGKEDKWIYLPSSKQTRRLTGESGHGGILGSELSVEDFDFNRDQGARNILQKEVTINNRKYYLLESDVNATSANYSKIVSYVSASEYLPMKVECFDKQGKLLKVLDISNYKKVAGGKWRAGKVKVTNIQNKRGTEIILSKVKLDQNLKSNRFSPKALAEE